MLEHEFLDMNSLNKLCEGPVSFAAPGTPNIIMGK